MITSDKGLYTGPNIVQHLYVNDIVSPVNSNILQFGIIHDGADLHHL